MLSRRAEKLIRCLLCLLLLAPAAVAAQDEAVRFQRAFARIDQFVAQHMEQNRTPGLALAVTNRQGLLRVATYGFADLKAHQPVTPDTLFQIGSISKSFTAISLLQLREEGKFDPQAPLTKYLPWFEIQTQFEPLTAHHLLTHSAGIPRDRDDINSSLYSTYALRERATGYAPGRKFAYSNIGYQTLGYLLETLEGQRYADIIRRRILEPLGMTRTEPVFTHDTYKRLAVGYWQIYDDRPAHRSHPVVEAPWFEYGAGDGSLAATAADLAAYLRMLLNRGATPTGRLLSEESFALLTQRGVKCCEDGHYGYGLIMREEDAHQIIAHSGGMLGFASHLRGDLDDGLGVVVFVNGPGNPFQVAQYALRTLRAALHNQELPAVPAPDPPMRIEKAADYAGAYTAPEGKTLTLLAEGESLLLLHAGERVVVEPRGKDSFYVPHLDFTLFLLRFGRDKDGKVVEASYGPDWYANDRYSGARQFESPAQWKAYPGHYRTTHFWFANFRILLRKGKLWLIPPFGGEELELVELEPGFFQIGTEETAERLRFDAVVEGKALRAEFSGVGYYRISAP
ncbi:MAG: serine hydrolase domain-containing protein [Candidatus Acidiferrales bacterium]